MVAQETKGWISTVNGLGESRSGAEGMSFLERLLSLTKETPGGTGEHATIYLNGYTFGVADDACIFPLETQGSADTDTLRVIGVADGSTLRDGMIIGVRNTNPAHQITIPHAYGGTGQVLLSGNRNKVLRDPNVITWLRWDLGASLFRECWPDVSEILARLAGTRPVSTLTVTGGAIVPTSGVHRITSAGAQDLTDITRTNFPEDEANILYLTTEAGSGAITVKHNLAKIVLADGTDFILAVGMTLILFKEGTKYVEMGRIQGEPMPVAGSLRVGTGSPAHIANLPAPPRDRMTLKSKTSDPNKMTWTDDLNSGETAVTGAGGTTALTGTSESFRTIDCTTDSNTDTLPDSTTVAGKTFYFYLKAAVGKTETINISAGNTIGKNLWTTTQLTKAGDILIIRSDGSSNWKVIQDNRGLGGIKPSSLGKNKCTDQSTYQSGCVMMANGQLVQAGLNIGLCRGSNDGVSQFGPVQYDAVNPPPANTTITDWVFTGSNLYVVLSNGWVYAGGQNAGGQLGQGDTTARYVLTRIPYFFNNGIFVNKVWAFTNGLTDQTMASAYFSVTAAGVNYVFAVGNNAGGQLGNGNTTNQSTPVNVNGAGMTVGARTVVDIQCVQSAYANAFAAVLLSDGTLYMTGINAHGALGQGNTTALTVFTLVPGLTGVTAIKLYGGNNGATFAQSTMAITSAAGGSLFVWGYNASYQGANAGTAAKTSPGTALLTNVKEGGFVGGTILYGCYALKNDKTLFTWGEGTNNILFGGNTTTIQTPTQKILTTIEKVWAFVFTGSVTLPAIGLIVLDTNGKLHVTGTGVAAMPFPVILNSNFAAGAYLAVLPKELSDGGDTIADIAIMNNAGINPQLLILTSNGACYGCSGGVATSGPLAKGHVATNTTEATNVYWYRLNKQLWE